MNFSEAVRYMMDCCDRDQHGLHQEVLEDFMHQCAILKNCNEILYRTGRQQEILNYATMAYATLLEWDI